MTQAVGSTLLEATIAAWNSAIEAGDHEAALAAVWWLHEAKGLISDAADGGRSPLQKKQVALALQDAAFHGDQVSPNLLLQAASLLLGKGRRGRPAKKNKAHDDMIVIETVAAAARAMPKSKAIEEAAAVLPGNRTPDSLARRERRIRNRKT